MAKRNYDKDLRNLRKELRKRIKQHKKRTDLLQEIEKTKLLKKRALAKQAKIVKKKPKPIKKVPVKRVKKVVTKKKVVTPPTLPKRKKKAPKKKLPKKLPKKKVVAKKKLKKRKWYEPKPKSKVKVYRRETGDVRGFSEDIKSLVDAEDIFTYSSRGSRSKPNDVNLSGTFTKTFMGYLKESFERDDVNIYRHGVIIKVNYGEVNDGVIEKIAETLEEVPNSSMHVTTEGNGFSIRLNFGDPENPDSFLGIVDSFKELAPVIRRTYDFLSDLYGDDIDWFDYWECDSDSISG